MVAKIKAMVIDPTGSAPAGAFRARDFAVGSLAFFLPTPTRLHANFVAFNVGAPHRYLAPESHALIGKDPHFRKYYVLGRVVHIERRTAEPDNRYSVPPGTQIELLSVETISHELSVDGEARSA